MSTDGNYSEQMNSILETIKKWQARKWKKSNPPKSRIIRKHKQKRG